MVKKQIKVSRKEWAEMRAGWGTCNPCLASNHEACHGNNRQGCDCQVSSHLFVVDRDGA